MEELVLTSLKPNEKGRVIDIAGCGQAKKRLYELGLNRGSEVKIVKNDIGPIIINISGNKLAIGRSLASKVIVKR